MDKILAFGKVNIGLNIGRYSKKYKKHKLTTILMTIDEYYDEIEINVGVEYDYVEYFINNQWIQIQDDVVMKSLSFFKTTFGIKENFYIRIIKNIPFKAGLGGSSSDAGNILKYLTEKYQVQFNKKQLLDIAINLGSDICFFLFNYDLALVSEYGNKLVPIDKNKPCYNIIANNLECSTKEVYECFREYGIRVKNNYRKIINNLPNINHKNIFNDLQNCAFIINNELLSLYKKLSIDKNVILTGSGSYFIEFK